MSKPVLHESRLRSAVVASELLFSVGMVIALAVWLGAKRALAVRSEEHTSELQSREKLVCRLLLEKKIQPVCVHCVTDYGDNRSLHSFPTRRSSDLILQASKCRLYF